MSRKYILEEAIAALSQELSFDRARALDGHDHTAKVEKAVNRWLLEIKISEYGVVELAKYIRISNERNLSDEEWNNVAFIIVNHIFDIVNLDREKATDLYGQWKLIEKSVGDKLTVEWFINRRINIRIKLMLLYYSSSLTITDKLEWMLELFDGFLKYMEINDKPLELLGKQIKQVATILNRILVQAKSHSQK